MGVKDLWSVLEPYSERKPLFELQGKTVAIDLAGWVCESLCVVDYSVQPRFYLRNLFFRTCYLLLSGVTPVYVLEGSAPALKYGVICKRNETQFIGARPRTAPVISNTQKLPANPKAANRGRSSFNFVLKQCEELIVSMGLTCVQGPGEAEAFCAYMNHDKMVDGVISQDSDCFAYGAQRVYRNFSVASQGRTSAQGGAVDVYDLEKVQKSIDFGQNKMIAMALLCGCDYCPDGVEGVGRDATSKLFSLYSNAEILDRLRVWREHNGCFTEQELRVDDKDVCVNCGHRGKLVSHTKSGCGDCRQLHGCDEALWKDKRLAIKSELMIRKKAMVNPAFPSEAVIDEFLKRPVSLPKLNLQWKQPNVVKFLRCMTKMLQWDEVYCFQKFLPVLTRWQLFHFSDTERCRQVQSLLGSVVPVCIKKKRTPKGVASYEIVWKDNADCFKGLIPEEQLTKFLAENNHDKLLLWSTIEPADLVQSAYPDLVERFLESKAKKINKKTSSRKLPHDSGKTTKDSKKRNQQAAQTKPITPVLINRFLQRISSGRKPVVPKCVASPKISTSSEPMNLSMFSFSIDDSAWTKMDEDSPDLSAVINNIVERQPNSMEFCGRRLRFEAVNSLEQEKENENSNAEAELNLFSDKVPTYEIFVHESLGKKNDSNESNKLTDTSKNRNLEANTSLNSSKVPKTDPQILNESFDEFDRLVMGTSSQTKILSDHSSTPLSHKPISNRNDLSPFIDPNESFFRMIQLTEDTVNFEKSIDFRNMPDEPPDANRSTKHRLPSVVPKVEASSSNDSMIQDSFNLSGYIPIGKKLRKQLSS